MVLIMQGIQQTLSAMSQQPPIPFPVPRTSRETPRDDDTDGDESDDEGLKDIETVIANGRQFHHVKTIGRLAVALARESVFGNKELSKCTVDGIGRYPALDKDGMRKIERALRKKVPAFQKLDKAEFKSLWKDKCRKAIGKACQRLRTLNKDADDSS